jgi:hypothetical protein
MAIFGRDMAMYRGDLPERVSVETGFAMVRGEKSPDL